MTISAEDNQREYTVQTSGLTKTYESTHAVDDLNLTVSTGSVYGFLGPNGAGKTTTMRLLTGLITPTEGTAKVAGISVSDRDKLVQRIGYAPADPPLYELLTGREQLAYAARFRDMDAQTATDRIRTLLDRFDLMAAAGDRIESYSSGMQRKMAVIQAVLHEPDVLILDEPTSGLDPQSVRKLRELLGEYAAAGGTVFLSTHDLAVVNKIADVIGVLNNGQLVAECTPEELKSNMTEDGNSLEQAFINITESANVVNDG